MERNIEQLKYTLVKNIIMIIAYLNEYNLTTDKTFLCGCAFKIDT